MRRFEFSRDVLTEIERDRFTHPDPLVQRLLDSYEAGGVQAVRTFHWKVPVRA